MTRAIAERLPFGAVPIVAVVVPDRIPESSPRTGPLSGKRRSRSEP